MTSLQEKTPTFAPTAPNLQAKNLRIPLNSTAKRKNMLRVPIFDKHVLPATTLTFRSKVRKNRNPAKKCICTTLVSQRRKTLTIEELSFLRCSSTGNRTLVSRDLL
jgi:hypothetical protein